MADSMTTPIAELVKRLRERTKTLYGCHFQITGADIWYTDQDRHTGEPVQVHVASGEGEFIAAAVETINALPTLLDALEALSAPPSEGGVEAVARAIHEYEYQAGMHSPALSWEREPEHERHHYRHIARAAIAALPRRDEGERMRDDGEATRLAHSIMPGSGATFKTDEEIRASVRRLDPFTRSRIDGLVADNERLRGALKWIDHHYANQDMSHVDFRVEAYSRARAALTPEPR